MRVTITKREMGELHVRAQSGQPGAKPSKGSLATGRAETRAAIAAAIDAAKAAPQRLPGT